MDAGDDQNRRPPSAPQGQGTPKSARPKKRVVEVGQSSGPRAAQKAEAGAAGGGEDQEEQGRTGGECSECGRYFTSRKALFGHMRSHPERNWRGINPPPEARASGDEREVADSLIMLSTSSATAVADNNEQPPPPPEGDEEEEEEGEIGANNDDDNDAHPPTPLPQPATAENTDPQPPPPPPPPPPEPAPVPAPAAALAVPEEEIGENAHPGLQMFQCAGCRRIFDSHQALGGHRASHRNVKGCYAAGREEAANANAGENSGNAGASCSVNNPPPPRPNQQPVITGAGGAELVIGGREWVEAGGIFLHPDLMMSRGHDYKCSVCFKSFPTGQALGGHMRWHLEREVGSGAAAAGFAGSGAPSSSAAAPPPPPPPPNPPVRWSFGAGGASSSSGPDLAAPGVAGVRYMGIGASSSAGAAAAGGMHGLRHHYHQGGIPATPLRYLRPPNAGWYGMGSSPAEQQMRWLQERGRQQQQQQMMMGGTSSTPGSNTLGIGGARWGNLPEMGSGSASGAYQGHGGGEYIRWLSQLHQQQQHHHHQQQQQQQMIMGWYQQQHGFGGAAAGSSSQNAAGLGIGFGGVHWSNAGAPSASIAQQDDAGLSLGLPSTTGDGHGVQQQQQGGGGASTSAAQQQQGGGERGAEGEERGSDEGIDLNLRLGR